MGVRHQAFVIARLQPHNTAEGKYRCIAAYHHQFCEGTLPLYATRRFLTLVAQPHNAQIVRAEIDTAHGKWGRWREKDGPCMPEVPCPFVSFVLGSAWTTSFDGDDPEQGGLYSTGITYRWSLLSADMGSRQGDNNSGISVIDVTDPLNPAYCFLAFGSSRPSNAAEYSGLGASPDGERPNAVSVLQDVNLVEAWMLAEAWPGEYEEVKRASEGVQNFMPLAALSLEDGGHDGATAILGPPDGSARPALPSLVDACTAPAVMRAIEMGNTQVIEEMLWMPGKAALVKAAIQPLSPFPDGALPLLKKLIEGSPEAVEAALLDISGYGLNSSQIKIVLAEAGPRIVELDLSGNPLLTVDALLDILPALVSLERLTLFNTPIPDSSIARIIASLPPSVEALIHPALFRSPSPLPPAFTFLALREGMVPLARGCSIPLFTPHSIVQALIDYLTAVFQPEFPSHPPPGEDWGVGQLKGMLQMDFQMKGSFPAEVAFSGVSRVPGKRWGQRDVTVVTVLDTALTVFQGEGWLFALTIAGFKPTRSCWGFVKFEKTASVVGDGATAATPSSAPQTVTSFANPLGQELHAASATPWPYPSSVHDLTSFLSIISEGRTPAPVEAVAELQGLFNKLAEVFEGGWISPAEIPDLIQKAGQARATDSHFQQAG